MPSSQKVCKALTFLLKLAAMTQSKQNQWSNDRRVGDFLDEVTVCGHVVPKAPSIYHTGMHSNLNCKLVKAASGSGCHRKSGSALAASPTAGWPSGYELQLQQQPEGPHCHTGPC